MQATPTCRIGAVSGSEMETVPIVMTPTVPHEKEKATEATRRLPLLAKCGKFAILKKATITSKKTELVSILKRPNGTDQSDMATLRTPNVDKVEKTEVASFLKKRTRGTAEKESRLAPNLKRQKSTAKVVSGAVREKSAFVLLERIPTSGSVNLKTGRLVAKEKSAVVPAEKKKVTGRKKLKCVIGQKKKYAIRPKGKAATVLAEKKTTSGPMKKKTANVPVQMADFQKTLELPFSSWKAIVEDLNVMRINNVLCDVSFAGTDYLKSETLFKGHAALLAANSKVFYKILVESRRRSTNTVIRIPNISTNALQIMVDFIYGVIPGDFNTNTTARNLLQKAADVLDVKSAHEYLSFFKVKATSDNVGTDSTSAHVDTAPGIISKGKKPLSQKGTIKRNNIDMACLKCGEHFKGNGELITHMQTSHDVGVRANISDDKPKLDVSSTNVTVFRCNHCSNIYISSTTLQEHVEASHPEHYTEDVQTESDGAAREDGDATLDTDKEVGTEEVSHREKRLCGPRGGRDYPKDRNLVVKPELKIRTRECRKVRQNGLRAIEKRHCSQCDETFYSRCTLHKHLWAVHKISQFGNVKGVSNGKFNCSFCSLSFDRRKLLRNHKRLDHYMTQQCPLCLKGYQMTFNLLVHMHNKHPGHEYFICILCGKNCESIQAVQTHFLELHDITASYPQLRGLKLLINPMNMKKFVNLHKAVGESSVQHVCEWGRTWFETHYTCSHCLLPHKTYAELESDVKRHLVTYAPLLAKLDQRSHECQLCGTLCGDRSELSEHLQGKHQWYMTCTACKIEFSEYDKFKEHCREDAMKIAQQLKDEYPSTSDVVKKMKLNIPCGPYSCVPCKEDFELDVFKFLMHNIFKHSQQWIMCSLCGHVVTTTARAKMHFAKHKIIIPYHQLRALKLVIFTANIKSITPLHTAVVNYNKDIITDWARRWLKSMFLCGYCNATFPLQTDLTQHIQGHIEEESEMLTMVDENIYECKLCDDTFDNQLELGKHELAKHNVGFKCDICGKMSYSYLNAILHRKQHSASRPFGCDECGKTFKQQNHLTNHLLIHTDIWNYACDVCGKRFKTEGSLRQHIKLMHNPNYVPKHECKYCGTRCHTITSLRLHLTKHTDERPHMCDVCGDYFKTERVVRKHLLRIHGVTPPPAVRGRPQTLMQIPEDEMEYRYSRSSSPE